MESTGVAHGLAANANVAPATKEVKNGGKFNDLGSKLLPNEGNLSWTSPSKFNPMTMAKTATEIGATTPICPNAFPAVAAKTPNKANAEANPTANAIAFTRIADFFASSFSSSFSFSDDDAYPPMYPNVNGNTDSVHGDKLVTNPATNTNTNVVGEACADADDVTLLNKLPLLFAIISPPPPPNAPLTNASNPDVTSNSDFDNTASATFAISLVLSTINAFVGVLRRPKARRRRRKR